MLSMVVLCTLCAAVSRNLDRNRCDWDAPIEGQLFMVCILLITWLILSTSDFPTQSKLSNKSFADIFV